MKSSGEYSLAMIVLAMGLFHVAVTIETAAKPVPTFGQDQQDLAISRQGFHS